jgi:hypothetical protein
MSALERVMRRATVHTSYAFSAQLRLQALLSAGIIRHTERVDVRPSRTLAVPVHGMRQPLRVLVTQRVLHQRLVERLTRTAAAEATGASPRVGVVTRVDRRQAASRIEMAMVRAQAPAAKAAATIAEAAITAAADVRPGDSQPRVGRPAPPLVLPAQELSRLTEHVIRQLDHRVLSWQERTGRV